MGTKSACTLTDTGDVRCSKPPKSGDGPALPLKIKKETLQEARKQIHRHNMKRVPDEWIQVGLVNRPLNCNLYVEVPVGKETLKIPFLAHDNWTKAKAEKAAKFSKYFDFYCTRTQYSMASTIFAEVKRCKTAKGHKITHLKNQFLSNVQDSLLELATLEASEDTQKKLQETVTRVLQKTLDSKELFLMLAEMSKNHENSLNHALVCSLLLAGYARHLRMTKMNVEALTTCGLLHDIGMYYIDPKIAQKHWSGEILTRDEAKLYKTHTEEGRDLVEKLTAQGTKLPEALPYVCLQHHENYNGTGFPNQIHDKQDKPKIHPWSWHVKICSEFVIHLFNAEGDYSVAFKGIDRKMNHYPPECFYSFKEFLEKMRRMEDLCA